MVERYSPGDTANDRINEILFVCFWNALLQGFGDPHDVATYSPDGSVYVADIGYNRVWKFEEMEEAVQDNAIWPDLERWRFY